MDFFIVVVIGYLPQIFLFHNSKRFSITIGNQDTAFLVLLFVSPSLICFLLFFSYKSTLLVAVLDPYLA